MAGPRKGNPIPTKFDPSEEGLIETLHLQTGLSKSEIVRRSVRCLAVEIVRRGRRAASFVLTDLAPNHSKQHRRKSRSVSLGLRIASCAIASLVFSAATLQAHHGLHRHGVRCSVA